MERLVIGAIQTSPVWLDKAKTIDKVIAKLREAKSKGCELVAFGEAFIPGYPLWTSATNACRFDNREEKEIFEHYSREAVDIQAGDLESVCKEVKSLNLYCVLGIVERARDRGGHTLYCGVVFIDNQGVIKSVHRKLVPTYDERLVWGPGDGHGLVTHQVKGFRVSVLNCWENWMPLVRAAMYAQGTDLHVAVWPGSKRLTEDISRFVAKEGRLFLLSVSATMTRNEIGCHIPHCSKIKDNSPDILQNGGSCIVSPDGSWIIEPKVECDEILMTEIDLSTVYQNRQNFDPAGHYSRPDVTKVIVNRVRQSTAFFQNE